MRGLARELARRLGKLSKLGRAIAQLARAPHRRCRVASRRKGPSTLDRLRGCDPAFDRLEAVA